MWCVNKSPWQVTYVDVCSNALLSIPTPSALTGLSGEPCSSVDQPRTSLGKAPFCACGLSLHWCTNLYLQHPPSLPCHCHLETSQTASVIVIDPFSSSMMMNDFNYCTFFESELCFVHVFILVWCQVMYGYYNWFLIVQNYHCWKVYGL